jgi:hypothetical protein
MDCHILLKTFFYLIVVKQKIAVPIEIQIRVKAKIIEFLIIENTLFFWVVNSFS